MNKKVITFAALISASMLLASCPGQVPAGESTPEEQVRTVDTLISEYLSGTNLNTPSLAQYISEYDFYYYREYEMYVISGSCEDASNSIAASYAVQFTSDTKWVVYNDDDYPVSEYGYMFADNFDDPNIELDFDSADGVFSFSLYKYDGTYGSADVSSIDTHWYVDYVREHGLEVVSALPEDAIKTLLGVSNVGFPTLSINEMVLYPLEAGVDEDGNPYAASYGVIFEGDVLANIGGTFGGREDYTVYEIVTEEFDWSTWDYVEVTTYRGYDNSHALALDIQKLNGLDTMITFQAFGDLYVDAYSQNTDYTESEKTVMNTYLGQVMPFFSLGDGYQISAVTSGAYPYIGIYDNFYQDNTATIANLLMSNGFVEDTTTYSSTTYVLDNHTNYLEVWLSYNHGNVITIYYEPTRYVAATDVKLNISQLDICIGASYQLQASTTPTTCDSSLSWTSSSENVTVSDTGLVTVLDSAVAGSAADITVTTSEGLTATCRFSIYASDALTGATFNVETLNLAEGETFDIQPVSFLPYGTSANPSLSWGFKDGSASSIHVDGYGHVWLDDTAQIGDTATIFILLNGDDNLESEVVVNVVAPSVTHTLNQTAFGLTAGNTTYGEHTYNSEDGASYKAQCAAGTGIQIRSKNSNSGIVGHFEGKAVRSITLTYNVATKADTARKVEIYASNTEFSIADMYNAPSGVVKVTEMVFDEDNLTCNYEFQEDYSYFGIRSASGAIYIDSIDVCWHS